MYFCFSHDHPRFAFTWTSSISSPQNSPQNYTFLSIYIVNGSFHIGVENTFIKFRKLNIKLSEFINYRYTLHYTGTPCTSSRTLAVVVQVERQHLLPDHLEHLLHLLHHLKYPGSSLLVVRTFLQPWFGSFERFKLDSLHAGDPLLVVLQPEERDNPPDLGLRVLQQPLVVHHQEVGGGEQPVHCQVPPLLHLLDRELLELWAAEAEVIILVEMVPGAPDGVPGTPEQHDCLPTEVTHVSETPDEILPAVRLSDSLSSEPHVVTLDQQVRSSPVQIL